MTRRQRQSILGSILVGGAATLGVLAADRLGILDRPELITLDHRFSHFNPIEPSRELCVLAIDDRSLEAVGWWPWSRVDQAALVGIPAEFGARAVLVDLTWAEYEGRYQVGAETADLLPLEPEGVLTPDAVVVDADRVLADAIEAGGNTYLAYHHHTHDPLGHAAFEPLVDALRGGRDGDAAAAAERLAAAGASDDKEQATVADVLRLGRIVAALRENPRLDVRGVVEATGLGIDEVRNVFAKCRHAAVRWRMAEWLDGDPQRWEAPPADTLNAVHAELTGTPLARRTPLGRALVRACRELLSYRATTSRPLAPLPVVAPIARPVDSITPVHFLLARRAKRCCFANFEADVDGVVRWLTLFEQHDGNALAQLGFAVAWDELGLTPERIEVGRDRLVLRPEGRAPLAIQLDERQRTLVPWARGGDWTRQFDVYPATLVMRLHDLRGNQAGNERLARELLRMMFAVEPLTAFHEYAELLDQRAAAEAQAAKAAPPLAEFFGEQIAQIDAQVARGEQALRDAVAEGQRALASGADPPEGWSPDIVEDLAFYLGELDRARAANEGIAHEIAEHAAVLREAFDGRICLVGYTATSLADLKPIPTYRQGAPGVLAHANILNGVLSGRMVYWSPAWANVLMTGGLGLLGTLITSLRDPRRAVVWVLALAVLLTAGVYLAFYHATYWVPLVAPLAALLLSYVAISVYRYIFVDSEARQLATALGQYTSKEIARQMAENPELCRRAEMREVTSIFTDLRGFTTISERIGAERTQKLLNTCLGRFTDVMIRHEALVNKFMGDGVFAFWNPVIYPQADHARRACESAVDLIAALNALKAEQRGEHGDEAFQELHLRVGVATGQAIVGPCGSEQKYDYTCIGDCVNLAARLESANKFYGTSLLVGGLTREQASERFVYRPLGGVQVKGKREAVPVYELLGRPGEVDARALAYAERFGEAVAAFQRREFTRALELFEACRLARPEDLAAQQYIEASMRLLAAPPGPEWTGALELTEK